jgi:molybdate transport system substrate-binding protein
MVVFFAISLLLGLAVPQQNATPRIAAASDLKFALDEVAAQYTRDTGAKVDMVYGSSGLLTRQLRDGAPFDVFLSADENFIFQLADAGLTNDRGVLYAIGRLVIFAPRGSPLTADPQMQGLRALLEKGGVTRFAIANPEFAPYGRAAQAALTSRGLWPQMQPKLALGENVAQAAQFATTGGAVGGLIAHSYVLAPPLNTAGTFALIPETDHPPLRQRMALLKRAGPGAEKFFAYLQQRAARTILKKYGFTTPD